MKKLHVAAMAFLLMAAMLLGGCSKPGGTSSSGEGSSDFSDTAGSGSSDSADTAAKPDDADITEESKEPEEPEEPEDPRINGIRSKYDIRIPMGYVEESFDIAHYELPEYMLDKFVYYEKQGVIDNERIAALLYNDNNRDLNDFAIYNFANGSLEVIYQPSSDKYRASQLEFVNSDYLVFSVFEKDPENSSYWGAGSMYIIDLASGDYAPTPICVNNEIDLSLSTNMVLLDGKLYFDTDGSNDWRVMTSLYCYDIETGKLEKIAEEGEKPAIYKGTIVYVTQEDTVGTAIKSIDGTVDLSGSAEVDFWVCESDIFKNGGGFRFSGEGTPTSVTTGQSLFNTYGVRPFMDSCCKKYISFYEYSHSATGSIPVEHFVYDFANNRMLINRKTNDYGSGVVCTNWTENGVGSSMFYHYSQYNGREVAYQINVFTEK